MQGELHGGEDAGRRGDADPLFDGPGELRALYRAADWRASALGPPRAWPAALRAAVRLMLASPVPTSLWCGPGFVLLYNDAYRRILGHRHPAALGRPGGVVWPDEWSALAPRLEAVRAGAAVFDHEARIAVRRAEGAEEAWFTYSLSPLADEDGSCLAVYNVAVETTEAVRARAALTAAGERMRQQRAELEEGNRMLLENAAQLEHQAEMLRDTAALLEERTRDAEAQRAHVLGVLEAMSDAHAVLDHEFRFVTVNAAAERSLGLPRDRLLGRTHWEVFPASVEAESGRAYRRVAAQRVAAHVVQHYVGDGLDVHVEIDAYPTEAGGVAIFWRDVTVRVRAETAVRESESRYHSLFDSLDQGFCVIEVLFDGGHPVDYRFLEANPAFEKQTGLAAVAGKRMRELAPAHEQHWFDIYGRVAASGQPVRFRNRAEALDRWFDVYAFRTGRPEERKVAVLFTDVTAAQLAERERERLVGELQMERTRLREVFRRAPSFIVALRGRNHVYEFVNEAYYQLVGHRDVVGRPLLEALPELAEQGFAATLSAVLATGEAWVGRETPVLLQRTPGAPLETRYIDTVFQALTDAGGERWGVVAHGSDVTEQVLARREVERLLAESESARAEAEAARADAEAANRAKSEFLAVMSHELRTPLNAIGGYAELIEMGIRGPVTPSQLDDLRRIQLSQRHLLGLINEVLNYAKLETGTVHFELASVGMHDALADAQLLVAPQARARGLELAVGGADPSLAARADGEKLRQILVNLLSNAVKFTATGGRVEMSCTSDGPRVLVRVADTGIGIPADKLEAIFDPFVQVRADLTRTHDGTGLGLAISRDLARAMGGDITVRSTPGAGSTFTLVLPLA